MPSSDQPSRELVSPRYKRSFTRLAMPEVQRKALGVAVAFSLALLVAQGIGVAFAINRVALLAPDQSVFILQELPSILLSTAAVAFVLFVPLVLCVVLGSTHRFVGPLHRINKYLEDHLAGKDVGRLKLRKKDVLREMASNLDKVVAENQSLREQVSKRAAA